jgi:hypothetical protein
MNWSIIAVAAFVMMVFLGIIMLGLQFYVTGKLKKAGIDTGFTLSRHAWARIFSLGWQNAKQLGIEDIMTVWGVLLTFSLICGGIVAIYFFTSLNR